MFKYIFLVVLIIFTGCSHNNEPSVKKEIYVTKKVYKKISKYAILDAAKKLFILADKKQFLVDSYRNKLISSKVRFKNDIITVNLVQDKWVLEVVQEENQSRALLSLISKNSMDDEELYNRNEKLHNMFWSRIDYLLGLEKKWYTCDKYYENNDFDGILCDSSFLTDLKPKKSDIITNISIVNKPVEIFTLDKVDSEIYKATDLSIVKNEKDILKEETPAITPKSEADSENELIKLKTEMNTIIDDKGNMELLNTDTIIDKKDVIKENIEFSLDTSNEVIKEDNKSDAEPLNVDPIIKKKDIVNENVEFTLDSIKEIIKK